MTKKLLTLTCNPAAFYSPQDAYAHMSKAFTTLSKLMRRTFPGQEWAYVMVWEQTKKGWPHIHALVRSPYIPLAFLSKAWAHLTGAPVVDIRPANRDLRLHAYLIKYLTKRLAAPRGFRRFRTSYHAIDPMPPKHNGDDPDGRRWSFHWIAIQEAWALLQALGYVPDWVDGVTLYGPHISTIPPGSPPYPQERPGPPPPRREGWG